MAPVYLAPSICPTFENHRAPSRAHWLYDCDCGEVTLYDEAGRPRRVHVWPEPILEQASPPVVRARRGDAVGGGWKDTR